MTTRTHIAFITEMGFEIVAPIQELTLERTSDGERRVYSSGGYQYGWRITTRTYVRLRAILLTGTVVPRSDVKIRYIRFNKEDTIPPEIDFGEIPENEGVEVRDDWPHALYGQERVLH